MKHAIEFFAFSFFLKSVNWLPKTWAVKVGRGLGLLLYHLGLRRAVVSKNLEIAFGNELSVAERKELSKKIYSNLASVFFELLLLHSISLKDLPQYVELEGKEILEEAMKENKGVVLAGGHFGHWELLSAAISAYSTTMHGYAGRQKNDRFDQFLNQTRQKFGMVPISKSKSSTRTMLKVVKEKKLLGIIGDLNVPHDDLFVDFFGKKASMGQGLDRFTVRYKCPLLFAWVIRTGPLKHKAKIVRLDYQLSGDIQQDQQNIAQTISNQLEKIIREHPDQYFWVNKRWKTRPPEERDEDVYE